MEDTQISTPVEETVADTSKNVEPAETVETSNTEPGTEEITAETETTAQDEQEATETLYAGKYKSVEDLEKGYTEAQKFVNKASEFEKKYNELLEKQTKDAERIQQEKLQQAQYRGFDSVEQQEIADKVQIAELEYYANNLPSVNPEYAETARQYLQEYYNTGNKAYLNEAKRFFPSNFVEKVALAKSNLEAQLNSEFENARKFKADEQASQLAQILKTDFAEFLGDIQANEGKAKALKSFCDAGSINSKEDMKVFQDIYSQIAKYEREQAIKEYEAQKNIEATKQASQINSNSQSIVPDNKETYTDEEIGNMSMAQFDKIMKERGLKAFI
ncbi:MAG: hypothetical protein K2F81_03040 [Ruminococcus sp.]|nr:hypothetical protein [Ruminococcus sp.]